MTSMTPEEIRQHVGEVWEDDDGGQCLLLAVGGAYAIFRFHNGPGSGVESTCTLSVWLDGGNLPQSLRKAKPRMVKAPHTSQWIVWYSGGSYLRIDASNSEANARDTAAHLARGWNNVAIQAPDSDMMEVVKGFEQ